MSERKLRRLCAIDNEKLRNLIEVLYTKSQNKLFDCAVDCGITEQTVKNVLTTGVCQPSTLNSLTGHFNSRDMIAKLAALRRADLKPPVELELPRGCAAAEKFVMASDIAYDLKRYSIWESNLERAVNEFNIDQLDNASKDYLLTLSHKLERLYRLFWSKNNQDGCNRIGRLMRSATHERNDSIERAWRAQESVRYHETGMWVDAKQCVLGADTFTTLNPKSPALDEHLAHLLHRSAYLAIDDGDVLAADALLGQSYGIKTALGQELEAASTQSAQGFVAGLRGDYPRAVTLLNTCLDRFDALRSRKQPRSMEEELSLCEKRTEAQFRLARTFRWLRDFDAAKDKLLKLLDTQLLPPNNRIYLSLFTEAALLFTVSGDPANARKAVKRAVKIAEAKPNELGLGYEASNLGLSILLAVPRGHRWKDLLSLVYDQSALVAQRPVDRHACLYSHLASAPIGVRYRSSSVFGIWLAEEKGEAAAHQAHGHFSEAMAFCDALLYRGSTIHDLFFWKSLAAAGAGRTAEAEVALRHAMRTQQIGMFSLFHILLGRLSQTQLCPKSREAIDHLSVQLASANV